MTVAFAATDYGAQLRFTVAESLRWRPDLFSVEERRLTGALAALDGEAADLVARLLPRRRLPVPEEQLGAAPQAIEAAIAAGWIGRVAVSGQASFLDARTIAPTPAAAALHRAVLAVAFADEADDGSVLVRHALGSLAPDPRSAFARSLLGAQPPSPWKPFADRAALDAWLAARAARATGPVAGAYAAALAQVSAAAGAPLHLIGAAYDAAHHWAHLLLDCVDRLPDGDARVDHALRALRRAPLAPHLARRVWTRTWEREARPLRARRLAAAFADWALWPAGERARWRLRAAGSRASGARATWSTMRLPAWLERDGQRVVAQGEGVEAFVLARLARDGWSGVHAEGGFWLALAGALFAAELDAGACWAGPLTRVAVRPIRRDPALDRRAAVIARDPVAALAAAAHDGIDAAAARAVCAGFPRLALVELLLGVLRDPAEAAGLPDLLLWRDGRVALYEVKSPNDQLSDAQRAWLAWLVEHGVDAGVARVDARAARQSVAAWAAPAARIDAPAVAPARRPRPTARPDHGALHLDRGPVAAHASTGELVVATYGGEPLLPVARWNGRLGDAVDGWARPIETVIALTAGAVVGERRAGRVARERRWYTVPPGWAIPALVAFEAVPDGGLAPCATILMRPSGWLLPRAVAAFEPVVAPLAAIRAAAADVGVDWRAHPDAEPWRPEATAAAWGLGDELSDQLALIGATPYRLRLDRARLTVHLDLPDDATCLWTARDPRLVRGSLEIATTPASARS
ncbi:MAG TPA: VRR-NUC domain-containing protein [Planctomycetota bacterium]|nr:VRR-NUC domain-containing protein [Planctomycetota bacterium]